MRRRPSAPGTRAAPVGGLGTLGCFSFFPSKNLGAFGDGGLVTTNDPALATACGCIRNHGMEPKYYHHVVGGNFRLDALQAAVLRVKAPHLPAWTEGRRRNAARYRELLGAAGRSRARGAAGGARRPVPHLQPVRHPGEQPRRGPGRPGLAPDRDGDLLPGAVPPAGVLRGLGYPAGAFPEAERAAASTIALPIYGELTDDQLVYVADALASALGAS